VVDVGVRVLLKIRFEGGLEVGDLAVELGDDPDRGCGGGREGPGDRSGGGTRSFVVPWPR
jgi:hypothetical protein